MPIHTVILCEWAFDYGVWTSGRQDKLDGPVKSPTPALRCRPQSFNGRWLPLMTPKFARLEFELFTRPSKFDFLRRHQYQAPRHFVWVPRDAVKFTHTKQRGA